VAKIGRNEPCPCGSGKKYKKCCYRRHLQPGLDAGPAPAWIAEVSDLDALSNQANTLIRQERFEEAERVCQTLHRRYPDQIDALERYAQLYKARGQRQKAADYYRQTAAFAQREPGFDDESIAFWLEQAEQLDPSS
jgi:tetratricopeptide (TPR) repeat protein